MDDFKDKVVLITGAGKGKGRALAEVFVQRGAFVAVNDISPINLDDMVAKGGGKVRAYPEDVAKKIAIQTIIKQTEDDFGSIDILINHAAVEPRVALLDMDEWDWHRVLDVNLTVAFMTMQSVGRVMRERGSGVIVNLVTAPASGSKNEAAYVASLHGLIGLTRQASVELSEYNVHIHAVGTGIAEFHRAEMSVPRSFIESVLYLCKTSLNGQIVNVEEG